jgi:hypothetical protein
VRWWGLSHRETAESLHDLLTELPRLEKASDVLQAKDLFYALPLFAKPIIEIRATDDLSMLQSPMTFVPDFCLLPLSTIRATIFKLTEHGVVFSLTLSNTSAYI